MEVIDNDGNVSTHLDNTLSRWKSEYENLFSVNNSDTFDEGHLNYVQNAMQSNSFRRPNTDLTILTPTFLKRKYRKLLCKPSCVKPPV